MGGVRDITVDVHVIAATNRDLEAAIEGERFREDLFFRLNVIPIELPPLRERPEDIAPLVLHFVDTLCEELRCPARQLTPEGLELLERHDWPGNAREIRNLMERVLLLYDEETITPAHLKPHVHVESPDGVRFILPPDGVPLEEVEKELIRQALDRTDGNKTGAARLLGLTRDTLRYRLEKYAID